MKLREGNVFNLVCLLFCSQAEVPCTGSSPTPILCTGTPDICSNLFNLNLTVHNPYPDMFNLVQYEALTVGKQAVGMRLKCILASDYFPQFAHAFAEPRGALGTPPGFEFFHFYAVFDKKLKKIGTFESWRTPLRKILDPPLTCSQAL